MMSLAHSASSLLDQLDEVIAQLDDKQFQEPLRILNNATIGQHTRHTLEFFLSLIDASNQQVINYDLRPHDPYMECETKLARGVIQSIHDFLKHGLEDSELTLEANYNLMEEPPIKVTTTFYRELAYNIEHAIHHMALIKIGLQSHFPDVSIDDHFGVASSTIRFQKQKHPN